MIHVPVRARRGARLLMAVAFFSVVCGLCPVSAQVSDREALAALEATQAGFRLVHKRVAPAVVTIFSTQQRRMSSAEEELNQFFGFPNPFGVPRTAQANVSGSGVIIRPNGIVLTNSHVVQGSTRVTVQLAGTEKELPAEVIQTDPRTDLAILRITEAGTYPTAPLGDARTVQVGDWAIAFGSPYRLPSTMTVGTISATGRQLNAPSEDSMGNRFYDLIQTDAAINSGNSGGPLVNSRGEIIGINFMIFSPGESSGNIGIGFAIPINDFTKSIIDTLVTGRVYERGRLGIRIDPLTDAMREEFGVADGGVLVQSVEEGMAAAKAGIKEEDVIVEFNGEKITDPDQLIGIVERSKPGASVKVIIVRNKKTMALTVVLGSDRANDVAAAPANAQLHEENVGLQVVTITAELARRYSLSSDSGVLVTAIAPGSPAAQARLTRGDIIVSVGETRVASAEEFWTALSKQMAAAKKGVVIRVRSGNYPRVLAIPKIEAK